MECRLLMTDLDGTLLREDKTLSERTKNMLKSCREKGIYIIYATARSEAEAGRVLSAFPPDGVISNAGARISFGGKVIGRQMLSAHTVRGIIRMCRELAGEHVEITVDCEKGYFWNYRDKNSLGPGYEQAIYSDFEDFSEAAYKVTPYLEREADARKIAEAFPECDLTLFSGMAWRRFAAREADKGRALRQLAEHLGISKENIVAFGDDFSDIPMLEAAGRGVAMGNAIEEVKKAADDIALSNEADGVAAYMEKHILKRA